jgi:hypothetical protein
LQAHKLELKDTREAAFDMLAGNCLAEFKTDAK